MEWLQIARKTDIWTFGPDEMVILTDFSATMDFRASQTANSSVDSHRALQIFVVLHSPRVVKLIRMEWCRVINECTNVMCGTSLVQRCRKGRKTTTFSTMRVLRRLLIATSPSRVAGVEVWHRFAQKYDFKGAWDAAGKVVKQKIRTCEIERKKRFPTAWSCFVDLPLLLG
jgi:hypothetical protein